MDLYGQEPEVGLLAAFISRLENRSVIDVGAERGGFTEEMLRAGSDAVHVIEPEPANVAFLREHFRGDERVLVHECAISDRDAPLQLRVAVDADGAPLSFGHTVIDRPDTDEIRWRETVTVKARSLASLVEAGEIPVRVGILKVDTEGHDLAVIAGMGALDSDVVMVEHWNDLPHSLGSCPWTTDEMVSALQLRGFSHFAFIVHRGELVTLRWDDGDIPIGFMGNLIFLHDRVLQGLLPNIVACASSLGEHAVELAEARTKTADERLAVIEELKQECDLQASAAEERLAVIEELTQERDLQASAEHRERLETVMTDLAERGQPVTELEARLIADAGSVRLSEVENALRRDARRGRWWRGPAARVRGLTRPRIGMLRHYNPKLLTLPASYFETLPPDPAPTISLVTPSYQQGRFLDRTLYSVVSQKYPALEYVVQDGGSSDETVAVLGRFNGLLTSWKSEPDGGQADAINRGFKETTGEIMAWLNSDDLLLPGTLVYVARYFQEHPEVDVIYGHRIMIDETDGQIGAWILPAHDDVALTLADFVPQETLFWRRRIWEAAGGTVDPSFGYALDWDLLLRFRDAGATMVRLPRFIGAFRIHDEQKTTAIDEVGARECDRLLKRMHGRPLPKQEVIERLKPYLRRHVLVHTRHRIADRLPFRRIEVRTTPVEPWLRKPEAESLESQSSKSVVVDPNSPLMPHADSGPAPRAPRPPNDYESAPPPVATVGGTVGHSPAGESRGTVSD